jgi:hypothetical protein
VRLAGALRLSRPTDHPNEEQAVVLHEKDSIRENLEDDIYASADMSVSMPKYRFPSDEREPRHV